MDLGSNAKILPSSFLNIGRNTKERALRLQDAQGEEIHIKGMKDVCFVFETENGRSQWRFVKRFTLQMV